MRAIILLTGPSCSGKTTLQEAMMKTGRYCRLISFTTRAPRPGEVDGVNYRFVTEEAYAALKRSGRVIQDVRFKSCAYGTDIEDLEHALGSGMIPVVVVEPTGVAQFRHAAERFGFMVLSVFVSASLTTLMERFLKRAEQEVITFGRLSETIHSRVMNMLQVEYPSWHTAEDYDMTIARLGESIPLSEVIASIEREIPRRGFS